MFNIAVVKMKDIIKYFLLITITIICITTISNIFNNKIKNKVSIEEVKEKIKNTISKNLTICIEKTLPTMIEIKKENKTVKENIENKAFEKVLNSEISSISKINEIEEESKENNIDEIKNVKIENEEDKLSKKEIEKTNEKNEIKDKMQTQIITNNPLKDNSNVNYGNIKIKNQTEYNLTEEILKPDIKIDNKKILIFHTHSCESYTPSEKYNYTQTGNFRTTDLNYSVVRVGTELENRLKEHNMDVMHNKDYHDYPSYNGSYTRSLKTVETIVKNDPSDIIFDIHRDAIGSRSDYAPTVKIGEDECAQIMFVVGTNNGGLWHPNWNENLKFAVKVQQKAEEMYPGLFKTMMVTKSRYNQHAGKYASILEVGATGNTLEQSINSMKYLANVLKKVIEK